MEYLTEPGDTIMDFFAGSGTTAHAVLLANTHESPARHFICVQLPEEVQATTETGRNALAAGLETVMDVCRERVRRVINSLNERDAQMLPHETSEDRGFKSFRLAESNFKTWDAEVPHDAAALAEQLELHVHHTRAGRTAEDLLHEILLKSGYPLSTPVDTVKVEGKTVFSVPEGRLSVCLEPNLTLELIRAVADSQPKRFVCLDEGFAGNDQLKTNAAQLFKSKGIVFQSV